MTSPTNSFKEDLLKLAGLSETESKILEFKNLFETLPENLNDLEKKLKESISTFEDKKQTLEQVERNYRRIESELTDSREKMKEREAKLYELKTTKEYQATT